MSILDYIDSIRGKSDGTKKSIALFGSIVGTVMIVGIWYAIQGSPVSGVEASAKETVLQVEGPFSTIKDMSASLYNDVKDLSGLIKSKTSEIKEIQK